jgi:hypothetical protein
MRHKGVLVSMMLGAVLMGGTSFAQQGGTGSQMPQSPAPHGGQGMACPMMASGTCSMMGGGMHGSMHGGATQGGGMQGCGMMAGGMGGQMGGDPKALQMRGEMMKAMGDVMIKHGQMMEKAAKP